MKVAIIHNSYPQLGGEDTVVKNEYELLKKNGINVVLLIIPTTEKGVFDLIKCGLSVIWNPVSYLKIKKFLKKEKPDIVHCHNTFPLISPSIFAACKRQKVPVVQTIHNYRYLCPAGGFIKNGKICEKCLIANNCIPAIKNRCYRNSAIASIAVSSSLTVTKAFHIIENQVDALIALNEFGKQKLIEGGIPASKIRIKPNFTKCLQSKTTYHKTIPSFCFIGRLEREKGVEILLQAWNLFITQIDTSKKPTLTFAGGGSLKTLVEDSANRIKSIQYVGELKHDSVIELINNTDCLICPSIWYEGMPMTILEAFSLGKPVIASNIGGINEMVHHKKNGLLFAPDSSEELATCLMEIFQDREEIVQLSKNAKKTHKNHYSPSINLPLLQNIYEEFVK